MKGNLYKRYQEKAVSGLKEKFGYKNKLAVPKLEKASLNVGFGPASKDASFIEIVENTLLRITGQKPIKTKAKKSVSNFKIREGMVIGAKVTLRGQRMYDFVERLINITLPRVRDFRGLSPKSVDGQGNLSIGFKEYIAFPEIKSDEIEKLHGLEITIATTAKNKEEGLELLKLLGFPFKEK